jgi:hypothetical protein
MSLILAGIDEAGYGPTLGPLCVAMSAFRLREWSPGEESPDLWKRLSRAICRSPADAKGRIPIADSKALKLSNSSATRHPLVHLEHGVLSFLRASSAAVNPGHDADLFAALGCARPDAAWYGCDAISLPLGTTPGRISISASRLGAALEDAGIEFLGVWVRAVDERSFNDVVRRTGTKAEVTALAWGEHLRALWRIWENDAKESEASSCLRLVGDQLGGRTQYQGLLARELPACSVVCLSEGDARSRYSIVPSGARSTDGSPASPRHHRAVVQFMPEAEAAHAPVALASMAAKLVRELLMARFNRYWCARVPELKPTAGYSTDARRWLSDMRDVLHPREREALVRLA